MKRWVFLVFLLLGLFTFFYLHGYQYFSFAVLQQYHQALESAVATHYGLAVLCYMFFYILSVMLSLPTAAFFTLIGGFLFGPMAIGYVVMSATLGASLVFMLVRSTLGDWLKKKANHLFIKIEKGFQQNAFNYVLFLRLMPVFPFFLVNIVAALLTVNFRTFFWATFVGIIPIKLVYVMLGSGLNELFKNNVSPNVGQLLTPIIILPLLGLAVIALLPVWVKRKRFIQSQQILNNS